MVLYLIGPVYGETTVDIKMNTIILNSTITNLV